MWLLLWGIAMCSQSSRSMLGSETTGLGRWSGRNLYPFPVWLRRRVLAVVGCSSGHWRLGKSISTSIGRVVCSYERFVHQRSVRPGLLAGREYSASQKRRRLVPMAVSSSQGPWTTMREGTGRVRAVLARLPLLWSKGLSFRLWSWAPEVIFGRTRVMRAKLCRDPS